MKRMGWTFGVPIENTKSFILARPPVVVFTLCIASFGLVTFTLGLYVKHTSTLLRNPDELSWNDIAQRVDRLKFCLISSANVPPNMTGMGAVSVPFDMSLRIPDDGWKNFTVISGSLLASDLGFLEADADTHLFFSLSLNLQSRSNICLNLYYPPTVSLPREVGSCHPLQFNPFPRSSGAIVLPKEENRLNSNKLRCPEDAVFDLKLLENPNWTIFLKEDDRALVFLHMMATSTFLLTTFLMVLCYAAVRGNGTRCKLAKPNMLSRENQDAEKDLLNP